MELIEIGNNKNEAIRSKDQNTAGQKLHDHGIRKSNANIKG
jgi:hypothetical protein